MHFISTRTAPFIIIFSQVFFIILGLLTLKTCATTHSTLEISWLDAFFISTSSICTTGMTTIPISSLSIFGKSIVLFLTQIGGVGLSTLLVLISLALAQAGNNWQAFASYFIESFNLSRLKNILKTIFIVTFCSELLGSVLYKLIALWYGYKISLFYTFMMSVNIFCNTGFFIDNQLAYIATKTPEGLIVSLFLILAGSIGFLTIYELTKYTQKSSYRLSQTTKCVLSVYAVTSSIMITIILFSTRKAIFTHGIIKWILSSLFAGFSMRSCGISFITFSNMPLWFIILLSAYMLLGSAPLSTGSGMKTSATAVIAASIKALFYNQKQVTLFSRSISPFYALRSFAAYFYSIIIIFFMTITCSVTFTHNDFFYKTFITCIGAYTNVGFHAISLQNASQVIKIVLSLGMLLGRVNFILFFGLYSYSKRKPLLPEENPILA